MGRRPRAAPGLSRDPDAPQLITGDVPRFWHAVDRAAGLDGDARSSAFRELYLRPGSAGLREWMQVRLVGSRALRAALERDGWDTGRMERVRGLPPDTGERRALLAAVSEHAERAAAEQLARATATRARYYAGVRAGTLSIGASGGPAEAIRACFHRFKALYPDAVFPDVYFLIGRLGTVGTAGTAGILVGTELFGRDGNTPADELTDRERASAGSPDGLPGTIAHELAHYQQPPCRRTVTLLELALREGAADFVAALVGGASAAMGPRHAYGAAHESELWAEFRSAMHGTDASRWLYGGEPVAGRPADLGYYVGYRVCEAYYRRTADSRAAVRRILTFTDPVAFLQESGYAAFAESLPRPTQPRPVPEVR